MAATSDKRKREIVDHPTAEELERTVFEVSDAYEYWIEARQIANSPKEAMAFAQGFNTALDDLNNVNGRAFPGLTVLRYAYKNYLAEQVKPKDDEGDE